MESGDFITLVGINPAHAERADLPTNQPTNQAKNRFIPRLFIA